MTEVDDGWVELPAVHDSATRFDKKNSPDERDTESGSRVQWPNISGTPLASCFSLSIGFDKIRGLARQLLTIPSSRHLSKEVSPPTLVARVSDESLT